jgi:hypothetical protein
MAFENRRYVIIPASEINNIDFTEVLETAPDTCRYSIDGTQTFVKYEGDMPESVANIAGKSQEYTHEEILTILATEEWTAPITEDSA